MEAYSMRKIGMMDVKVNCAESSPYAYLSTPAFVLPNNQNSSIVTSTVVPGITCSGSSSQLGPSKTMLSADGVLPPVTESTCSGSSSQLGPSNTVPSADRVLPPVPDDDDDIDSTLGFTHEEILSMLAMGTEEDRTSHSIANEKPNNLSYVGNVEAASCLDGNNVHDVSGDLQNWAHQSGDGFNLSSGDNVKDTMDRTPPREYVLEMDDFKTPLPTEASGSEHFLIDIDGLFGSCDFYNNSKHLCYLDNSFGAVQHDFRLSQSCPSAKEFSQFEDCLDIYQKEKGEGENENQRCKAASYSVDVTPCEISELRSECVPLPQAQKSAYPHGDKVEHKAEGPSPPRGPHGLSHNRTHLIPRVLSTVLDTPILHEPKKHISYHARARVLPSCNLRKYGCWSKLRPWYYKLPATVRANIKGAGFEPFINTTIKIQGDRVHLHALAERWWDTTNTFHFSFGEIGITPYDFCVITGVPIGGVPIPYDLKVHERQDDLIELLGVVPPDISAGAIRYEWLRSTFEDRPCETAHEKVILTRVFFLYLLGCSLFCNLGNRVHLRYLPALRDVKLIGQYNWGGAAFAMLYTYMSSICRGRITSIGGYWRVLEIWSYEYLRVLAPAPSDNNPHVFPRALRWQTRRVGTKSGTLNFAQYRDGFSALTSDQVNWNPWDGMEHILPLGILANRYLSARRIMFEGPFGRSWFLGERLSMQTFRIAPPRVPVHPPPKIQASMVSDEKLDVYLVGYDASFFFNLHMTDYDQYVKEYLMANFPIPERLEGSSDTAGVRPSSSQARPSASPAQPSASRAQAGSSQVGGSSLSGGPSWNVSLPSKEGEIQPVDVVRTSEAEGVPLPPGVTQVSREQYEDALQLVAALKSMVQKFHMKVLTGNVLGFHMQREIDTLRERIRELERTRGGTSSSSADPSPAAHPPIFQRSVIRTSVLPSPVRQRAFAALPSSVVPEQRSPSLRRSQMEAVLPRGSCLALPSSLSSLEEVCSDTEANEPSPALPPPKKSAPSSSKGKGKKRSRN